MQPDLKAELQAELDNPGLLVVEMMRPKLPEVRTWPVTGLMFPPEANRALRLLIGLAKFG